MNESMTSKPQAEAGARTVCILGLGYIGLPTAAMFATHGTRTIGVDVQESVVKTINEGRIHIVEPGLGDLVSEAVRNGALEARLEPVSSDAYIIAVPTPLDERKRPDVSYVMDAARKIAPVLRPGQLVVLESTSPIGTTEEMTRLLAELRPDLRFPLDREESPEVFVAYCPERVLPGKIIEELTHNDRIIGGMDPESAKRAADLYKSFVQGDCILTNAPTAEMCKLAENAYRDVNIAYANELSLICDRHGIDVWELIELANRHPRVNILQPGCGVGGHCIAVDPWFLVASSPEEARLIRTAREINDGKPVFVLSKIREAIDACGKERPRVAILGLAFKPDIDDLRESPALHIAEELAKSDRCDLLIVEPHVSQLPDSIEKGELVTLEEAVRDADIIVALVRHSAFDRLAELLKDQPGKAVIDPAGLLAGHS